MISGNHGRSAHPSRPHSSSNQHSSVAIRSHQVISGNQRTPQGRARVTASRGPRGAQDGASPRARPAGPRAPPARCERAHSHTTPSAAAALSPHAPLARGTGSRVARRASIACGEMGRCAAWVSGRWSAMCSSARTESRACSLNGSWRRVERGSWACGACCTCRGRLSEVIREALRGTQRSSGRLSEVIREALRGHQGGTQRPAEASRGGLCRTGA